MILFVYPLLNDSISGEDPLSQVDPLGKNLVAVDIFALVSSLRESSLGRGSTRSSESSWKNFLVVDDFALVSSPRVSTRSNIFF